MIYTADIRQAGNLYTVTLLGSDGLTVDVGAAPSIAVAAYETLTFEENEIERKYME